MTRHRIERTRRVDVVLSASPLAIAAILALSLSTSAPAHAQNPAAPPPPSTTIERFTLESAVAAMRRGNPLLAVARANVTAAQADVTAAGRWTNPQLDANYVRGLNNNQAGYDPTGAIGLGVTQFIELAGVPGARKRAAGHEARATQSDFEVAVRDLSFEVEMAFLTLGASVARKQILDDTVTDLERADQIVRARVAAGVAPTYDASRITVALAEARAAIGDVDAEILRARGDLNVAVGAEAETLRGVPLFDFDAMPPIPPLPVLLERTRAARPDVAAARSRVESASEQVEVTEKSVFPGVGVRLGAGYGAGTQQLDMQLGLIVPLPLLDRGQGAIPAARARVDAAQASANALLLAVQQRVSAAYAEAIRRREALEQYREASRAVSAGMRSQAEAGYREARLSVLELVDAYNSFRNARLLTIGLVTNARVAEVSLRRTVGAGPGR